MNDNPVYMKSTLTPLMYTCLWCNHLSIISPHPITSSRERVYRCRKKTECEWYKKEQENKRSK